MAFKTIPLPKSKLQSWLFNAPAKFAGLSFSLLISITVIYGFFRTMVYGDALMSPVYVILIMSVVLIFTAYKLIKWLPKENLDRRSFVAVNNGLTVIYFTSFLLSTLFLITRAGAIVYYMMWLQYYSMFLFFVTMIAASLVYLYVLGLLIANIYAVYLRAMAMGIPKWKALLSFPFSFVLLWMPGYLLPEKTTDKAVISIKTKWFARFTDWVVAQPINAVLVFLFIMVFSAMFFNFYFAGLTLFFTIIFGLWVWIKGADGFRKSMGGAFATFTASLNIALIITMIGFISMGYNYAKDHSVQMNAVETIQMAETLQSAQ